jgi:anti-anti-sigma factor
MKVLRAAGDVRIVLDGELDLSSAPEFIAALQDLLAERPEELEIDLREITFLDSTGLRTLLIASDEARRAAIPLYVIPSASEQIRMVFEITNLQDALPWRQPVTEAQRATLDSLEEAYSADDSPDVTPAA